MDKYKPVMSFDEDVAEVYDNLTQRGDEMATVAFLEQFPSPKDAGEGLSPDSLP